MGTESRFAKTLRTDPQPAGRTTVDIECPFCQCVTQARAWSLAGSGKRCAGGCGALLSGKGIGMTVATRTGDPSPSSAESLPDLPGSTGTGNQQNRTQEEK